ncbi:MAG: FkbM family methyltransferase [Pseudomonadota bacterium]|nr:FkbM family methyltransferase [Pseudomonadota bacterium]
MSNSRDKTTLFIKRKASSNVIHKIQRFYLENKLNKLSRQHLEHHRQLVVFSFDYVSTAINIDGIYEIDELEVLFEWLKQLNSDEIFEGSALDVGANIGNHSLYFSDYFNEVLSYEPQPLTFKLLSLNSQLTTNIRCFNFGLSSSEKKSPFVVDQKNMGGSHIVAEGYSCGVNICLKTLDSVTIKADSPVKLIKIDVEGHEYDVLLGAKEVIKKNQPIIIFEQHKSDFIGNSTKSIDLIKSYNYSNFACVEKSPSPPSAFPVFLQLLYSTVFRLIKGSSRAVVMVDEFQPKFYPFIIAIPDRLISNIHGLKIDNTKIK